jgi:hypothetical protein
MAFGSGLFVAGAGLAVLVVSIDAHRLWRLALFLPFWGGAVGVLQAQERT